VIPMKYTVWIWRQTRRVFVPIALITIISSFVLAQAPIMKEQMVYGLLSFDGKGYIGSFCTESENTIYIIANSDNVLLPKMTLVYFWPISRRFRAGFNTLNEKIEGTLEVIGNDGIRRQIERRTYAHVTEEDWYAKISKIVLDEKARQMYAEYRRVKSNYAKRTAEYRAQQQEYRSQMDTFFTKVRERETLGKTPAQYGQIPIPKKPIPPKPPTFYVQEPREGYILNLPEGKYEFRLRAPDGNIVKGSEKKTVSFTHRRSGKTGYEIMSEKRWTTPEASSDPTEIIYLAGKHTLYLEPHIQTEYNHQYYSKLQDPQNDGHSELWRWVNIEQIEKGVLHLIKKDQKTDPISPKPYYVQQIPGRELGYTIVDYDKEKFSDSEPDIVGYKVTFEPKWGVQKIQLMDVSGKLVPGSVRELRAIKADSGWRFYIAALILPIAVGSTIFIWRRKKLK